MLKNNFIFFIVSIAGLIILFLVNLWGARRGYYRKGEENFWFDKIMHFCGGFFVAVFWFGLTQNSIYIILLTLIIGIIWEIAEYIYGVYKFKKTGTGKYMTETRDTLEDLFFDLLGAFSWLGFTNYL